MPRKDLRRKETRSDEIRGEETKQGCIEQHRVGWLPGGGTEEAGMREGVFESPLSNSFHVVL